MKLKNKYGFTLIELLAVIVVLAIIALIATPIVMNTIKKSQKGAAERSAENYIDAVETAVATAKLDSDGVPDGTYTIDENGNLTGTGLPNDKLTIEMSGNKPKGGTITIKNGQVTTDSKMTVGSYEVVYNPTSKKYEATEKGTTPTGVLCKANTTKATALVWAKNGAPYDESSYIREEVGLLASEATSKYDVGVTYTCELGDGEENTFYVLETSGDNVSLIAGMNLGATVSWAIKEDYLAAGGTEADWNSVYTDGGNNNLGPLTANKILKERTSGWTKLDENQITLPSGQQIATAGGDTKWTESNYTETTLPTWLNSYTKFTTGTYGYWTSSPHSSSASDAWRVNYGGILTGCGVDSGNDIGVRPVITVSKSNLS